MALLRAKLTPLVHQLPPHLGRATLPCVLGCRFVRHDGAWMAIVVSSEIKEVTAPSSRANSAPNAGRRATFRAPKWQEALKNGW